jgi:hypothetical protein
MDMSTYLAEVEHAATSLITLLWSEHKAVEDLKRLLQPLKAATDHGYSRASFIIENDFDDEGLGTLAYWDTYFGPDKERFKAAADVEAAKITLDTRTFSRASLSAALLQIAKQGLSTVHGGLTNVPAGRSIDGQGLRDVIWQGRNQSIHWEEGNPHQSVVTLFTLLSVNNPALLPFRNSNMAFEVISVIEWKDWHAFRDDMMSLG